MKNSMHNVYEDDIDERFCKGCYAKTRQTKTVIVISGKDVGVVQEKFYTCRECGHEEDAR